jgi:hypothetical protein
MRRNSVGGRFAERSLAGIDDTGQEERVVIWIERKAGALWAVGRAVNPHLRHTDALEAANNVLEDDCRVLEQDGREPDAKPFLRKELLGPLERWFFGRSVTRS